MQHLLIEATKLGMADVRGHVGDPAAMKFAGADFLDPAYLDARARQIDSDRAQAPDPGQPRRHGTVYLAAADENGMMVSFIQSNYRGFGSGVVIPGTGIAMNNRGSCFTLASGHANEVGPAKRPLQTIIPAFATRDGKPLVAFGVMGGVMQPQGHVQIATRLFAFDQNPQAAIDAPRWRYDSGKLFVEAEWSPDFRAALGAHDPFSLAALHVVASVAGSVVLALALADGELAPAQIFALSRIDEDYQASKWGRDHEAEIRARNLARELETAAQFIAAARQR